MIPLCNVTDLIGDFRLAVWNNRDTFSVQYNAIKVGPHKKMHIIVVKQCFTPKVKGFSSASGLRIIPFRNYEVRGDLRIDVVGFMPFGTLHYA